MYRDEFRKTFKTYFAIPKRCRQVGSVAASSIIREVYETSVSDQNYETAEEAIKECHLQNMERLNKLIERAKNFDYNTVNYDDAKKKAHQNYVKNELNHALALLEEIQNEDYIKTTYLPKYVPLKAPRYQKGDTAYFVGGGHPFNVQSVKFTDIRLREIPRNNDVIPGAFEVILIGTSSSGNPTQVNFISQDNFYDSFDDAVAESNRRLELHTRRENKEKKIIDKKFDDNDTIDNLIDFLERASDYLAADDENMAQEALDWAEKVRELYV